MGSMVMYHTRNKSLMEWALPAWNVNSGLVNRRYKHRPEQHEKCGRGESTDNVPKIQDMHSGSTGKSELDSDVDINFSGNLALCSLAFVKQIPVSLGVRCCSPNWIRGPSA